MATIYLVIHIHSLLWGIPIGHTDSCRGYEAFPWTACIIDPPKQVTSD